MAPDPLFCPRLRAALMQARVSDDGCRDAAPPELRLPLVQPPTAPSALRILARRHAGPRGLRCVGPACRASRDDRPPSDMPIRRPGTSASGYRPRVLWTRRDARARVASRRGEAARAASAPALALAPARARALALALALALARR